jgi:tetratricopeptide (TPR) repeat protein
MKLKRSKLVSNGSLNRMLQASEEAWNRKNFDDAIEELERASRMDPGNGGILLDLGRRYGQRYDYVSAERCFEKAVRMAPNQAVILLFAGQKSRDFGDFSMAERFFLRAAEKCPSTPEPFIQLARLYERLRRLDEAQAMVDRALHLAPHAPEALLARARVLRQTGQVEAAEKVIRSHVANPNPDAWVRAQGWYELGAILDRQGKFDDAMSAWTQAKALLAPQSGRFCSELKVIRKYVADMQSNLNAETFRRWLAAAPDLQPPRHIALLGGHPRSGTTLLEQVLDSHPDITSLEETAIFQDDAYSLLINRMPDETPILNVIEPAPAEILRQARANYFRTAELFLGQPIGGRLLIDKNPSLTFLIPVLVRIFPEIKLLVSLRDPRDVVLSCFTQALPLSQGSSAYLSLERTAQEYADMMSLWQTVKPMIDGNFLEVRYEDIVEDLEPVARKTLEFLKIPWDAKVLGFDEHARKKLVRSPTYADVVQPVYKRAKGRWRNYQKHLEPHLEKLEPFVKAFGYG